MSGLVIELGQLPEYPRTLRKLHVLTPYRGSQYISLQDILKVTTCCSFRLLLFNKKSNILKVKKIILREKQRMSDSVQYSRVPQPPGQGPLPCLVRNQATQQVARVGQESEASSVFTATPHRSRYCLSSAFCQISGSIRFS